GCATPAAGAAPRTTPTSTPEWWTREQLSSRTCCRRVGPQMQRQQRPRQRNPRVRLLRSRRPSCPRPPSCRRSPRGPHHICRPRPSHPARRRSLSPLPEVHREFGCPAWVPRPCQHADLEIAKRLPGDSGELHNRPVPQLKSRIRAFAALILALPFLSIPIAAADPPGGAPQGAHITDVQHVNDRWDKVSVYSPAMNKVVVNDVYKSPKS